MKTSDIGIAPLEQAEAAKRYAEALRRMASQAAQAGDATQAGKFEELAEKLEAGVLTIAFCGHFSAGKSTLVNALCGERLLPSSPIPTSANVVTIRNGKPGAHVVFRGADGSVKETPDLPVEQLSAFAVDGEGVAAIDVSYPVPLLGDRMALVDTPGVDSTDGAHRAATESALHLADVVFYVTDYNHVLSEVNFRFLRTLHQWGKPTYVIVNQVDKHRESEVSFAAFREGIRTAMQAWRIEPAGLLFLSLREPGHPLSQQGELVRIMEALKPLTEPLMLHSAARSARYLAEEHRACLRQTNAEAREGLLAELGGGEALAALERKRAELEQAIAAVESAGERDMARWKEEVDRLLGNANLTPAETREKAREMLESLQPGFKVGWLGSGAKTETERERRLEALAADFNAQAAANLHNHVRDLLRREAKAAGWEGAEREAELERSFPAADTAWLKARVKPGAGADGQATLNYAAETSAEWKAQVRKAALRLLGELDGRKSPARAAEAASLHDELARLGGQEAVAARLRDMDAAERAAEAALLALLPGEDEASAIALPSPHPVQAAAAAAERGARADARPAEPSAISRLADVAASSAAASASDVSPIGAPTGAAELLAQAEALIRPIPQLRKQADSLAAKAEQLRQSRFTIALFGAFSAGKSSFANALVGLPALPVSPNPTTATINRIVAPTADAPHGSAMIAMKTPEAMREDLAHSLERLGVDPAAVRGAADDAAALLALSKRMTPDDIHPRGRPHLAFLRAAAGGWARYGEKLGTHFLAGEAEYRRYVAEEE
ncbi:dynamin family protein, partial [Cohnella nanjingensis]